MFAFLLALHSLFRWIILMLLLLNLYHAVHGIRHQRSFSKTDNLLRHWAATAMHMQLIIGIVLYSKSALVAYYWSVNDTPKASDPAFFALIHLLLMVAAVVIISIGSALVKRRGDDRVKFMTTLTWYSIGFLILLIAIPWPFSPLSHRPFIRPF